MMYLFHVLPIFNLIPLSMDKRVSQDLLHMWTNFAKHGDPNGINTDSLWQTVGTDDKNDNVYFVIDEHLRMENLEELERLKLWK